MMHGAAEDRSRPSARAVADEVDRIVERWEAVTPSIDVSELHVFSRISRISWRMELVRRDAFAQHGLDAWEFDVLSALRREGPPFALTPGALIQETLVTSGTMTSRVEKLQARELVTKSPAPGDGRSVVVQLTKKGASLVDRALEALVEAERTLLDALPPEDQEHLGRTLRLLMATLEPRLSEN